MMTTMPTMKKTTVCLSEQDRSKAEQLMKRFNLSSLGQLIRFSIEQLAKEQ
jgi:hypothetical protein